MSTSEPVEKNELKQKLTKWGLVAAAIVIAFLIGIVPMWLSVRTCEAEHEATKTKLRRAEVSNLLSVSIVEARRGEYEPARQATSEFFTRLTAEIDKGDDGFLDADQRTKLNSVFNNRDAVITMLAQRDPASLDRLTDIYTSYQQVFPAKPVGAKPAQSTAPAR